MLHFFFALTKNLSKTKDRGHIQGRAHPLSNLYYHRDLLLLKIALYLIHISASNVFFDIISFISRTMRFHFMLFIPPIIKLKSITMNFGFQGSEFETNRHLILYIKLWQRFSPIQRWRRIYYPLQKKHLNTTYELCTHMYCSLCICLCRFVNIVTCELHCLLKQALYCYYQVWFFNNGWNLSKFS